MKQAFGVQLVFGGPIPNASSIDDGSTQWLQAVTLCATSTHSA